MHYYCIYIQNMLDPRVNAENQISQNTTSECFKHIEK